MNSIINNKKQKFTANDIGKYSVFIGFDGYIDEIVRPITTSGRYESIKQFNKYIINNHGMSADVSVRRICRRMGGNAPLLAYSLAKKGITVHCIGAFGINTVLPIFEPLKNSCEVTTIAEPAKCYALEFPDGKIMFGERSSLNDITPVLILQKTGERLLNRLMKSNLICFVNWSSLLHGNEILKELFLKGIKAVKNKEQILFLDLADLSTIEETRISVLRELLPQLQQRYYIVLSLNWKEAANLVKRCGTKTKSLFKITRKLLMCLAVDEITVHSSVGSIAATNECETKYITTNLIDDPNVVTGAGDNYNAGYCIGKLLGMDMNECVKLGNESAYNYICNGEPSELAQIEKTVR